MKWGEYTLCGKNGTLRGHSCVPQVSNQWYIKLISNLKDVLSSFAMSLACNICKVPAIINDRTLCAYPPSIMLYIIVHLYVFELINKCKPSVCSIPLHVTQPEATVTCPKPYKMRIPLAQAGQAIKSHNHLSVVRQ